MTIATILETALYVENLRRSIEFYDRVLGLKPASDHSARLCALDVAPDPAGEGGDGDPGDAAVQPLDHHVVGGERGPGEPDRAGGRSPAYGDLDRAALVAAQQRGHRRDVRGGHVGAAHAQHHVTGEDARPGGRRPRLDTADLDAADPHPGTARAGRGAS